FLSIASQGGIDLFFQAARIRLGLPRNEQRTNLSANEVIGAAGAKMSERLGVRRVYETKNFREIVKTAYETLPGGNPPSNKWENLQGKFTVVCQGRCLRSAEKLVATLFDMAHNKLTDLVDDCQGACVAFALRAAPGEQTVSAEDNAIAVWRLL